MESLRIRESREPLYVAVTKRLIEEIETGVFRDADRLPSEEKLAQLFGVSRTTVREALSVLEKDGYLKRVHGVGTWIMHNHRMPIGTGMERITSCTEYMRRFGYEPGTKLAEFQWVTATTQHKQSFERELDIVGVLTRVRTADGTPIMLCYDIMPPEVIGADFTVDKLGESLFDYLAHRGVGLKHSELVVTAIVSDAQLAEYLEIDTGVPLLLIDDRYFDDRGDVLLCSRNIYRTDRWVFKVFRNGETG